MLQTKVPAPPREWWAPMAPLLCLSDSLPCLNCLAFALPVLCFPRFGSFGLALAAAPAVMAKARPEH